MATKLGRRAEHSTQLSLASAGSGSCGLPLASYRQSAVKTLRYHLVRIDHELLRCPLIEILVAFRRFIESKHCGVDSLRRVELLVENGVHELPVIAHDRALARGKDVGLCPAQSYADAEIAGLGRCIHAAWIVGHIETRNADASPRLRDAHERVQDRRGPFHYGFFAVAARLKAHAIDRALHFWNSDDLLNLLGKHGVFPQVDDLAAEAFCLRQPLGNHVADDHARRAEQLAAGCAG